MTLLTAMMLVHLVDRHTARVNAGPAATYM
jgi:hypothetical protein